MTRTSRWDADGSFTVRDNQGDIIVRAFHDSTYPNKPVSIGTQYNDDLLTSSELDGLIAALVTIRDIARRKERG